MRYHLILLSLGFPLAVGAQTGDRQRSIDSLLHVLVVARSDTDSLRTLIALSSGSTGDERMRFSRMGLELSQRGLRRPSGDRRKFLEGEAGACSGIGSRFRQLGQSDSALAYYQRGLRAARECGARATEANLTNGMGVVMHQRGDIDSALSLMSASLVIREAIKDSAEMPGSLLNMAAMYHFQGNVPRAIEMYDRARRLAEATHNSKVLAIALVNIGALHETQGELDSALAFYRRAIVPLTDQDNTEGLGLAYNNMATVFLSKNDSASAREAVLTGIPFARRGRNYNALSDLYFKLARIEEMQGRYEEAVGHCLRSISMADSGSYRRGMAFGHLELAKIDLKRGDAGSALRNARLSEQKAGDYAELNLKKERAQVLGQVHEALKNYPAALEQYHLFQQLADSLTNEKNKKDLVRKSFQYEYDKRGALQSAEQDKRDAVAAKEIQKQRIIRNGFMGGFAFVALFAGVFLFQRNRISKARKRSDELLLNILPEEVAEELKDTGAATARHFDQATILFTDFKGFTQASEKMSPQELVEELNACFKAFDGIITARGIEKIKTIGDAYMCAGGLPDPRSSSPGDVVHAALEMQAFIRTRKAERDGQGKPYFEMRVGIHTGPVVAGIVGVKKFAYDIWGDTVNIASRMESSGEVGQVNISESTYALLKDQPGLSFAPRGKVQAKGKGELEMYFVITSQTLS